MDFREHLHPANTVRRNFSASSARKRRAQPEFEASGEPPIIEKIFATKVCIWCLFEGSEFFIFCPNCYSCQYCGLWKDYRSTFNHCGRCGNNAPDDTPPHKGRKRFIAT